MSAQDNWVQLLLMAHLAFNSRVSATTGYLPFFANYGHKLSIRLLLTIENLLEEGLQ